MTVNVRVSVNFRDEDAILVPISSSAWKDNRHGKSQLFVIPCVSGNKDGVASVSIQTEAEKASRNSGWPFIWAAHEGRRRGEGKGHVATKTL